MLITPEYVFKDVTHITPEWLASKGIAALVLDIDNTLTADRSQELPEEVAAWLAAMRKAGVKLTIVSNGAEKRVRPFAEKLGLAYLSGAHELTLMVPCPPKSFNNVLGSPPFAGIRRSSTFLFD